MKYFFSPYLYIHIFFLQVSQLPYQFTSVKDFEASVRAPIGRTFVPEAVHKKLTTPAVTTKKGTVIEPMTENELLALKKEISVKK